MKIRILIALLLFVSILTLAYGLPSAEARPFSNFKWNIDETYHRDGHVQFVVQKSSENFLPIEVKGLNNVTVTLHPTINHDQTGEAKLPRGVDIYFEPDMVTLTYGEIKTVKLVINVDENAPANLYDVQIVGTWKEENNSSGFMGSAIRLHVGHDFGDGKIPVNMLDPPLKFWKYIKNEEGIAVNDVPCRNDYVLIVKHDGSPACVTESTKQKLVERGWVAKDDVSVLVWKKHITISATRHDYANLADFLPTSKMEEMPDDKVISQLLVGADGCKNETEVCKIPSGVSLDRQYSFLPSDVRVSDNDQFSVSLDVQQAEYLLSVMDWKNVGDSFFNVVQQNEKQYIFVLSTFENPRTPVVKMNLVGISHEPVLLERGMILEYPILVETWATYGAPAQIDLMAVQDTKDSGIDVWTDPQTITVPERSNATSTLFIKAQDDANDGLYDIRIMGHANGKLAGLYCSNTVCPTVNIGNSAWSIRTFGSGSDMGIGGIESPKNTFLELELNKIEFFEGDTVEIKAYLINNGTETVTFVPDRLLIKVIKAQDVGYYDNLYGIDARYESDEPLVLEPDSKTLLVRPFYWNQNTFENFDDEQRVDARQHKMISKFVGEKYAWNDDVWFEVK